MDPTEKATRGFERILGRLFDRITISEENEKIEALKALSLLRNSLHNNSINRNESFQTTIKGKEFVFKKDSPTQATIFDVIFLIDHVLDVIDEIINAPEVAALPAPIPVEFHPQLTL